MTVDAYFKEARGTPTARWEKTEKIGRVAGVTTRPNARANRKRHRRGHPPQAARPSAPLDEVAEIERDRRTERRLIPQSLLAILFVVTLVVVGRLLAP